MSKMPFKTSGTHEYDSLGRKTRTWAGEVGSTALTALSDITYTYDGLSRLSTVNTVRRDGAIVDSNGATTGTPPESTTYHYDLLGRMDYTEMLRAELWSHFWPNCDGRDLGVFFERTRKDRHSDLTDGFVLVSFGD